MSFTQAIRCVIDAPQKGCFYCPSEKLDPANRRYWSDDIRLSVSGYRKLAQPMIRYLENLDVHPFIAY